MAAQRDVTRRTPPVRSTSRSTTLGPTASRTMALCRRTVRALEGQRVLRITVEGRNHDLRLVQNAYQGTPLSSFTDLGLLVVTNPSRPQTSLGRGKWANITQDPVTGAVTLGTPYNRRTPWFTQTDFHLSHSIKVNKNNEARGSRSRQPLSTCSTSIPSSRIGRASTQSLLRVCCSRSRFSRVPPRTNCWKADMTRKPRLTPLRPLSRTPSTGGQICGSSRAIFVWA